MCQLLFANWLPFGFGSTGQLWAIFKVKALTHITPPARSGGKPGCFFIAKYPFFLPSSSLIKNKHLAQSGLLLVCVSLEFLKPFGQGCGCTPRLRTLLLQPHAAAQGTARRILWSSSSRMCVISYQCELRT